MIGMLRFGIAGTSCAVMVAMLGCGPGSAFPEGASGTLSGKVTLDGSPAPQGTTVTMIHKGSAVPALGIVGTDGTYTAQMAGEPKVLTGDYRVTVADPPKKGLTNAEMAAGGAMPTATKAVVPAKYNIPETSGLTVTVNEGENTFDIPLTSK